ncbi:MAG: hypothetical protein A07HR60_02794 [uncultured archaeon A07HR60]|jgi:hypothetical protein|nr:MAG: hypothetical protein A07HR60_02794 [uncultured archaeon A07HR60]
MSDDDLEDAVSTFLDASDTVYGEYEQGYVNADVALSMLSSHLDTLQDAANSSADE